MTKSVSACLREWSEALDNDSITWIELISIREDYRRAIKIDINYHRLIDQHGNDEAKRIRASMTDEEKDLYSGA